jgi:hypothetical protein
MIQCKFLINMKDSERSLDSIADTAKQIQNGTNPMTDLVFNPVTGEFEQRPRGTSNDGDVVNEMAKTGFA